MRSRNTKLVWLLFCYAIVAQQAIAQVVVSGRVTDHATGAPLAGATVKELNGQASATTGESGAFTLSASSPTATLTISYVGYQVLEVALEGRKTLEISLFTGDSALDEVVVVGYGTRKKVNLTGAVSTVQSQDLVKVPAANVSEALIGKAPGLFTKQNTGVPGNDFANLSIRGYDAPLVLVDGVETSWTRMDPNEIESVSVLKDAAAAVYGARAGNGVILITTKRGKEGKATITLNSNYTTQSPTTLPEFVPSWQFAELLREGEFNNSIPYTFTEEEIQKFKAGGDPDYVNEDWYKAAFRHWAPMHSHTLTVNGGTDRIKYHMTAGYLNQSSIYKSGDMSFNRYNVRSNVDARITDRLAVSFDLSFRNEVRLSPEIAVNNLWTNLVTAQPVWPATLPDPTKGGAYSGFLERSPVAQTFRNMTGSDDNIQRYFTGRINLSYQIPGITGLDLNATLNYSINNQFTKIQDRPFRIYSYNHRSGEYEDRGINGANSLNENFSQYTQLYPLLSLNYNREFGSHAVQGLLLAEGIDTDSFFTAAGRLDLLSVEIPYLFAGAIENLTNNGGATKTGRVSYVGRGNYAYKDKYLLEGTFRFDASHKFAPESRWGFFPSVSAAWRIAEEDFIKDNISWMDNLKLRASYSKSGNDNVDAFKYLTGYEILRDISNVYVFGTDVYRLIRSTGLPNPDITWLDMTSYNLGLDATFMGGKLGFEVDAFYRITDNIFGQPLETYPSTFGAVLPQLNINSTADRGIEFTVNHRNRIGDQTTYGITGMMSFARQKYRRWSESPFEDEDEVRIYQLTGKYTNRWIGYLSDGIFMSQDEIDNHAVNQDQAGNTTLQPGDIRYRDLNGDNIIDWRDQDEIGYGTFPDLSYGLNFDVTYKGISVTALFQGASMFNSMITGPLRGALQNLSNPFDFHYKYRWQPDPNNPGVNINPDAKLPAVRGDGIGTNTNNNRASDFWLQDATYVRLRNLNVNYSIPAPITKRIGVQQLNVFVAGSNLFTLSRLGIYKKSVDPEATDAQKLYPPVRSISFGINLSM